MRTRITDKLLAGAAATLAALGLQWLGLNPAAQAADGTNHNPPPARSDHAGPAKPAEGKTTRYPVRGKLKAVDPQNQTVTLAGSEKDRVFQVTTQTELSRHGQPATLADAVVGENVGGLVERQTDGRIVALKLRFGPKTENEGKPAGKAKRLPASSTAGAVDVR